MVTRFFFGFSVGTAAIAPQTAKRGVPKGFSRVRVRTVSTPFLSSSSPSKSQKVSS